MQPPFVGPSYNLESRPASVQRTVNMVPVPLEPGNERAGWGFEDVPGLSGPIYPPAASAFEFNVTPHDLDLTEDITYVPGPETSEAAAAPLNTWTEIELRRDSSNLVELLVNGVVRAFEENYTAHLGSALLEPRTYDVGSFDNNQEFFIGQIDRVRVTEAGLTVLSIDFDGPDGATTFTDATGSTLTRQGSVVQTDAHAFEGTFSADFPGSSNIASNRVKNVGTFPFSLKAAVRPTSDVSPGQRVISSQDAADIDPVLAVRVQAGGLVQGLMRDPDGMHLLILDSSDALAGPLAEMTASTFIDIEIEVTGVPTGMTTALIWDGMAGSVTIEGTPTVAGTYVIGITYRATATAEVLDTSSHTVVVA